MSPHDMERVARTRANETTRNTLRAARRAVSARGGYLALKELTEALAENAQAQAELLVAESVR